MLQAGNCVHWTETATCSTGLVRELRQAQEKRVDFFVAVDWFFYLLIFGWHTAESHGVSGEGKEKKRKEKRLLRQNIPNFSCKSGYLWILKIQVTLAPPSSMKIEFIEIGPVKVFKKFQRQFWCRPKAEVHCITKCVEKEWVAFALT